MMTLVVDCWCDSIVVVVVNCDRGSSNDCNYSKYKIYIVFWRWCADSRFAFQIGKIWRISLLKEFLHWLSSSLIFYCPCLLGCQPSVIDSTPETNWTSITGHLRNFAPRGDDLSLLAYMMLISLTTSITTISIAPNYGRVCIWGPTHTHVHCTCTCIAQTSVAYSRGRRHN